MSAEQELREFQRGLRQAGRRRKRGTASRQTMMQSAAMPKQMPMTGTASGSMMKGASAGSGIRSVNRQQITKAAIAGSKPLGPGAPAKRGKPAAAKKGRIVPMPMGPAHPEGLTYLVSLGKKSPLLRGGLTPQQLKHNNERYQREEREGKLRPRRPRNQLRGPKPSQWGGGNPVNA